MRQPKAANQHRSTGQRVGYIRVSTMEQNTQRQLEDIQLDRVFTDHASGKDTNRPQLQVALAHLREGDTFIVHSMDRLSRNLSDLLEVVDTLTAKGIIVEFHKPSRLVFDGRDDKMARMMMQMLGAVAEFERAMIKERQREGIEAAKKRGVYKGRKPSLTADRITALKKRVKAGENRSALAREFRISRETLYKYASTKTRSGARRTVAS